MRSTALYLSLAILIGLAWTVTGASAQQVTISTPYHAVSDSFFENMGTAWGLGGPNWNLNVFGSPNQAAPQFGGFDPSAGANLGFGFGGGGFGGSFLGNFAQGSRRSFVSQVPSVTLPNGGAGGIFDASQSPFVISYIPVVGGFPTVASLVPRPPQPLYSPEDSIGRGSVVQQALREARNQQRPTAGNVGQIGIPRPQAVPLDRLGVNVGDRAPNAELMLAGNAAGQGEADSRQGEALSSPADSQSSSADRGAMSVDEAHKLHQAEQAVDEAEVLGYIERARAAEAAGKPNVAKIYYQIAYRRATGQLRQEIETQLRAIEPTASP